MVDVTAESLHTESEIGSDSAEEEAEVRGEAVWLSPSNSGEEPRLKARFALDL